MDSVVAASRAAIVQGSSSFRAASALFDAELRDDVHLLYAWCRYCDDVADGQDHGHGVEALSPEERRARVERLRAATLAALHGGPVDDPPFAALRQVARKRGLPERWPLELIDGFAMDASTSVYARPEDMLLYCWGVAGVVGVMMALIMGVRDEAVLQRAQDLGLGFQLTNICRDVYEDARAGRVFLPAAWLERHGVAPTPAAVLDPANAAAVFAVVVTALDLAEDYYGSARAGVRDLPFRAALAVAAARDVYRAIGRRIRAAGPAALGRRMVVPRPWLLWFLVRGAGVALWSRLERRGRATARPALWSRI